MQKIIKTPGPAGSEFPEDTLTEGIEKKLRRRYNRNKKDQTEGSERMVIDFHTHTFPDKIAAPTIHTLEKRSGLTAASDGTQKGLTASMEKAGVTIGVVLPVITKPEQFATINTYARKITPESFDGEGLKLLSFGAVHPYSPSYREELREIRSMGLKGIKIHPDYLGIMIDDPKMLCLLDEASNQGLVISIHAGIDIGLPAKVHCPPQRSAAVLRAVRPEKCVLAHMGGFRQWDQVEELLMGQNVYLDTSMTNGFMDQAQMKRLIKGHGAKQILFGTDSPWGDQGKDISYIKELGLTEEEEEAVLWKNAAGFLELA